MSLARSALASVGSPLRGRAKSVVPLLPGAVAPLVVVVRNDDRIAAAAEDTKTARVAAAPASGARGRWRAFVALRPARPLPEVVAAVEERDSHSSEHEPEPEPERAAPTPPTGSGSE